MAPPRKSVPASTGHRAWPGLGLTCIGLVWIGPDWPGVAWLGPA